MTDWGFWRLFSSIWNFLETERADCRGRPHELMRYWTVKEEEEEDDEALGGRVVDDVFTKRFWIKESSRFLTGKLPLILVPIFSGKQNADRFDDSRRWRVFVRVSPLAGRQSVCKSGCLEILKKKLKKLFSTSLYYNNLKINK